MGQWVIIINNDIRSNYKDDPISYYVTYCTDYVKDKQKAFDFESVWIRLIEISHNKKTTILYWHIRKSKRDWDTTSPQWSQTIAPFITKNIKMAYSKRRNVF